MVAFPLYCPPGPIAILGLVSPTPRMQDAMLPKPGILVNLLHAVPAMHFHYPMLEGVLDLPSAGCWHDGAADPLLLPQPSHGGLGAGSCSRPSWSRSHGTGRAGGHQGFGEPVTWLCMFLQLVDMETTPLMNWS